MAAKKRTSKKADATLHEEGQGAENANAAEGADVNTSPTDIRSTDDASQSAKPATAKDGRRRAAGAKKADKTRPTKKAAKAKPATPKNARKTATFSKTAAGTKAKPGKPTHGSKTAFVRSLPSDMSARDVVAKAKLIGLHLSEAYVYKIRSDSNTKAKTSPQGRPTVLSPSATAGQTATDFVRALPQGTSAKEAVALAKKAGIPLTMGYFYTLRSTLKRAGKTATAAPASRGRSGALTSQLGLQLVSANPHEQAVINAVAALGPERVRAVLETAEKLAH